MQINGKCAIVTGGASGLGAATARMIARRGGNVVLFDLNAEAGMRVADEVEGLFCEVDVADETSIGAGFDKVERSNGPAQILVNCAGISPCFATIPRAGSLSLEAFRRTIDVNIFGTFLPITQFASRLRALELPDETMGVIINTSSIVAFDGHVGHAAYAASKAGVAGMTLPLARELCAERIRVMTIAPGLFDTPMMDHVPTSSRASMGSQVPLPERLGNANEFAMLVEAIITNPMLNGEVIRLDGALRLGPQ